MTEQQKEAIRDLIAQGRTAEALASLKEWARKTRNQHLLDEVALLSGKLGQYREARRRGTQEEAALSVQKARINDAVLDLLRPDLLQPAGATGIGPDKNPIRYAN